MKIGFHIAGLRRLIDDMRPMTWKQRIEHIWLNYKEIIIVAVLVMVMLYGAISMIINSKIQPMLSGVMVNMNISQDGRDYLTTELFDKLGGDPKTQSIGLSISTFIEMESVDDVDKNYNATMGVIGLVASGSLDYIIMDEPSMEFYIIQDIFCELDAFMTQEELDRLQDQNLLLYAREESSTKSVPYVIDITETQFAKDCLHVSGKVYIAFSANPTMKDSNRVIWDYLMAWEKKA